MQANSNYPPPPPYGMNVPPPHGTFVQHQVTIVPAMFGLHSTSTVCASCHKEINTRVEHESTTKTHLFAFLLCLLFCPCAILPYCMDSCKATNHYCPKCGAFLGTYDS